LGSHFSETGRAAVVRTKKVLLLLLHLVGLDQPWREREALKRNR